MKQCLHLLDAVTAYAGICLGNELANSCLVCCRIVIVLHARVGVQTGAILIYHDELGSLVRRVNFLFQNHLWLLPPLKLLYYLLAISVWLPFHLQIDSS